MKRLIIALIFSLGCSSTIETSGPDQGRNNSLITHGLITNAATIFSPQNMDLPVYLTPVPDARYGTQITRIGNFSGQSIPEQSGSWGTWARHEYSKQQPWNADGTLYIMENRGGDPSYVILDGQTFKPVKGSCDYIQGEFRWHPTKANLLYQADYDSASFVRTVQVTYDKNTNTVSCSSESTRSLPFNAQGFGKSEGNVSFDGKFAAFENNGNIIVFNLETGKFGNTFSLCSGCDLDWVSISPSGEFVVASMDDMLRVMHVSTTLDLTLHNTGKGTVCGKSTSQGYLHGLGHADMRKSSYDGGEDVIIGQNNKSGDCGGPGNAVTLVRLRDGRVRHLTNGDTSWPHHISTRGIARPGWAYVSYSSEGDADAPMYGEIVALRMDGAAVERLGFTHGTHDGEADGCPDSGGGYRCEFHGVPSPDGTRVVFSSNWQKACGGVCGKVSQPTDYVISTTVLPPPPAETTAPSVPSNLSAVAISSSQINLSWNASTDTGGSGMKDYIVFRNGSQIAIVLHPSVIFSDSSLSASTSYTYTVRARDGANNTSAPSDGATKQTLDAPAPPPSICTGSEPFCDDFADGNVAGWDVVKGSSWNATSTVLKQNDTSDAWIKPSSFIGTNYSVSANVKVTNSSSTGIAGVYARFNGPNDWYHLVLSGSNQVELKKKSSAGGIVRLASKTLSSGVVVNTVYRLTLEVNGNQLQAYLDGTALFPTPFTDSQFSSGGVALGTWKRTAEFDNVLVTTIASPPPLVDSIAPSVPNGLESLVSKSSTSINLQWNSSTDSGGSSVKEYRVFRNGTEVGSVVSPITSFQDGGLSPSTAYTYTVRSVDTVDNESEDSSKLIAITASNAPYFFYASPFSSDQILLLWTLYSYEEKVDRFRVYRAEGSGSFDPTPIVDQTASLIYIFDKVSPSTQYRYKITAVNKVEVTPGIFMSVESSESRVKSPTSFASTYIPQISQEEFLRQALDAMENGEPFNGEEPPTMNRLSASTSVVSTGCGTTSANSSPWIFTLLLSGLYVSLRARKKELRRAALLTLEIEANSRQKN